MKRGKICIPCDNHRVLWASKSVCAICALECNSKKRKLTDRQVLEVEAKDQERKDVKYR